MAILQNYEKYFFVSSKELFSFLRYSNFCNFFPSSNLVRQYITKGLDLKGKIKLTFSMLSDNPLSKYFIFKRIFCMQRLLLSKIKKRFETSIWCTFSAWFLHENIPYVILSIDKVYLLYLFSFTGYQTKCVIKFLFRQLMTS